MAQNLRKMADRFDYQADQLDQLRNYIPIEKHDLTPVLKVVNFILKQPNHAAKKNVLIREYSSIYNLDSVQVDRLYENTGAKIAPRINRKQEKNGFNYAFKR